MSEGMYEVPIPYDTFAPAVRKALQRLPAGWRDFKSESEVGYTVFTLSHIELGDNLGTVELYKVGNRTELLPRLAKLLPTRLPTQEELDTLEAVPDEDERQQRSLDLLHKLDDEREELYYRRKSHFVTVISTMFSGLYHDLTLRWYLQAEGNTAALAFLARWAGQEPQVDSDGVAERDVGKKRGLAEPTPTKDNSAGSIVPDELEIGGSYGTNRDLTIDDVRTIVAKCLAFQERGGKVPDFYEQLDIEFEAPRYFELETLRGWLKDSKLRPKKET